MSLPARRGRGASDRKRTDVLGSGTRSLLHQRGNQHSVPPTRTRQDRRVRAAPSTAAGGSGWPVTDAREYLDRRAASGLAWLPILPPRGAPTIKAKIAWPGRRGRGRARSPRRTACASVLRLGAGYELPRRRAGFGRSVVLLYVGRGAHPPPPCLTASTAHASSSTAIRSSSPTSQPFEARPRRSTCSRTPTGAANRGGGGSDALCERTAAAVECNVLIEPWAAGWRRTWCRMENRRRDAALLRRPYGAAATV